MKALKFLPLLLGLIFISCGGEEEVEYTEKEESALPTADYDELSAELDSLELVIAENPSDKKAIRKAITRMQDFADFFPDDAKAADYLLKASDLCLMVDEPAMSVKILDKILNKYPDYEKISDVLYVKADHLDWELRDTIKAKETYQKFIDTYPHDNRAADAKLRIKYIAYGWEAYTNMVINGEIEPVQ